MTTVVVTRTQITNLFIVIVLSTANFGEWPLLGWTKE